VPPPAFTLVPSAPTPPPAELTAIPTEAPPPAPEPTAAPTLVRLTEPGCCVQPFWAPDGSRIFFLDKPAPDAPSGLYAIHPDRPGMTPEFFSDKPGYYSQDMSLLVYPENGLAVVENLFTGDRWEVNTNGNAPAFSPDGARMVWSVGGGGGPNNARRSDLYVANVDGSEARFRGDADRGRGASLVPGFGAAVDHHPALV
jgi:Tol biopolymer transport system component